MSSLGQFADSAAESPSSNSRPSSMSPMTAEAYRIRRGKKNVWCGVKDTTSTTLGCRMLYWKLALIHRCSVVGVVVYVLFVVSNSVGG